MVYIQQAMNSALERRKRRPLHYPRIHEDNEYIVYIILHMCLIIFFTLLFNFFFLSLSSFALFNLGFLAIQYTTNCLCEGHVFTMPGNHLPEHNHLPFVGNYPSTPIIRNAVNPATPVIIQF